jgi:hypothetical protein
MVKLPRSIFNDDGASLIIAYQHDKSMTKRIGKVHAVITIVSLQDSSALAALRKLFCACDGVWRPLVATPHHTHKTACEALQALRYHFARNMLNGK